MKKGLCRFALSVILVTGLGATGVFAADQAIELYTVDNGPNQPEFFNTIARPLGYPCSNLAPGLEPVLSGNITVHDAAGA